jgi:hypothetical protein
MTRPTGLFSLTITSIDVARRPLAESNYLPKQVVARVHILRAPSPEDSVFPKRRSARASCRRAKGN